jgi:hypothetical protein
MSNQEQDEQPEHYRQALVLVAALTALAVAAAVLLMVLNKQ